MKPCCPPKGGNYLPISTGNIGISQTTGGLEFYGHNFRGTGIGLFYGQWKWPPFCPPAWPPPTWGGMPGGCSCGGQCGQCCSACQAGTNCFAQMLTNPRQWICYYQNQAAAKALTTQGAAA